MFKMPTLLHKQLEIMNTFHPYIIK